MTPLGRTQVLYLLAVTAGGYALAWEGNVLWQVLWLVACIDALRRAWT